MGWIPLKPKQVGLIVSHLKYIAFRTSWGWTKTRPLLKNPRYKQTLSTNVSIIQQRICLYPKVTKKPYLCLGVFLPNHLLDLLGSFLFASFFATKTKTEKNPAGPEASAPAAPAAPAALMASTRVLSCHERIAEAKFSGEMEGWGEKRGEILGDLHPDFFPNIKVVFLVGLVLV